MKNCIALALFVLLALAAQAAPKPEASPLQRIIEMRKTLPVPTDWHFFLSNEAEWRVRAGAGTHTAYSNLAYNTTFIRERYVQFSTDYELRHTIAHEMGHRICNCTDESTAEGLALTILKQAPR